VPQRASGQPAAQHGPPHLAGARAGSGPDDDERLRSAPVDPWATGEAAAIAAGQAPPVGNPPTIHPFSGPPLGETGWSTPTAGVPRQQAHRHLAHDAQPGSPPAGATTHPAPVAKQRGRRRAYILIALTVTVALAAGAVVAYVFWPGYRALDYHPLSDPIRIAPIVPVSSEWSDAEILGDRVYFASAETETGRVGVVSTDVDGKRLWQSTEAGTAPRWKSMIALPMGVALFTDTDSTTSKRRMAVLSRAHGTLLWQRTIDTDDEVYFAGDTAVLADRDGHRLLGLRLTDGAERWTLADPPSTYASDTHVIPVTTPKDLGGPATVFGRAYEPDLGDDRRIVQIGADRSVRVLDADTGKVLASRQNVADPDDEAVAHNGRLIVLQPDDQRIVSYDLGQFGEPKVLYTTQAQNSQMKDVTPCGDDRVCFDEEVGYDGKSATVVSLDVAGGKQLWRYPLANVETIVGVGEAVLATTTTSEMSLINGGGKKIWTHTGEAARLDGGNLIEFSKPLSRSPDGPALTGRHVGDGPKPLGSFDDVRSDTCSWNTSTLACVAEKDFVIQKFAG
jgi:molecular chaperone HscA